MTSKEQSSPSFIANPFVKKRNLDWTLQTPTQTDEFEPDEPKSPASPATTRTHPTLPTTTNPSTAAIESGNASTTDHLTLFTNALQSHILRPSLLPIPSYAALYRTQAASPEGAHFVIHQHDHPVAGTHYDLRLQINETSSVSWAVMYGLPGDPNSLRLNRNATETRIHCLWNHLIETASNQTGSLLIWDTGTYSILPRRSKHAPSIDPSSPSPSPPDSPQSAAAPSQQTLLHEAFQNRKIRLRLHGAKLPDPYVLNLRLTKGEDMSGRARSAKSLYATPRKRRRRGANPPKRSSPKDTSDEEEEEEHEDEDEGSVHVVPQQNLDTGEDISAMEREIRELEDEQVRKTNAYPGASNTIHSVDQRKWYLSLDRSACGFVRTKHNRWDKQPEEHADTNRGQTLDDSQPDDKRLPWPFYVRGADHERSVVTSRRGADILQDEGVTNFIPRAGWRPVLN